jgi:hypothetical protein
VERALPGDNRLLPGHHRAACPAGVRQHVPRGNRQPRHGRSPGTRPANGSSARPRQRSSWPRSWRRLSRGCRQMPRTLPRPGADLIAHYLDPDRLPVQDRWSRKHGDIQRRLCQRFAAPVIATVTAGLDNPPAVRASLAAHGAPRSIAVEHRAAVLACCVSPHSGPRACWAPRECAAGPAWRAVPDRAGPSPLDRWRRVARVGVVGYWFGGCGGAGVCRARCWQLARW